MIPQPTFRFAFAIACLGSLGAFCVAPATRAAQPAKTRAVAAGDLKLAVPESWKQKAATNRFRVAQFSVPKAEGDPEDGEFVVFYFGGGGGAVDANVSRWVHQFLPKDRKVKAVTGKCPQGEYVLVDLEGTWKKPIGPPIQQRTVEMPNARVLGVILQVKDAGNYFLRLTGPKKTISANVDAFRASIGADAKSEKDYKVSED